MRSHNSKNKRRSRSSGSSRRPLANCTNLSQTSSTSSTNNSSSFPSSFEKPPFILSNFPNTRNKPGSTHAHKSTSVFLATPSRPPQSPPLPVKGYNGLAYRASTKRPFGSAAAASFSQKYLRDTFEKTQPQLHSQTKECGTLSADGEKKHGLSQDFIERRRAYFAEIDAFELSEEEVGSSNELD